MRVVLGWWLFLAVFGGLAWYAFRDTEPVVRTYEKEMVVGAESAHEGYCLKDTVTGPKGEVLINEQHGGVFDYQLIATTRGIEVWVPCE